MALSLVGAADGLYFLCPFERRKRQLRKLENYTPTKFMAADSTYNKSLADYAVNFIECLCHTKGTWAGKPFELIDWQERIIRDIFGIHQAKRLSTIYDSVCRNSQEDGQVRACCCGGSSADLRRR